MSDNKPKPIPRKTPGGSSSGAKKSGPSMREQIAARRKAEAAGQPVPPKAAPRPAAKVAPKPAGKPISKPAPKKVSPLKRAAAAPAKTPAKAAASAEETVAKATKKETKGTASTRPTRGAGRSGAGSKRAGAAKGRRGAAAAADGDGDGDGGTTRGRRGRPEPKKKSPIPAIAIGVAVLGGAGAYFGGVFDAKPAEAAETIEGDADVDTAAIGAELGSDGKDAMAAGDTEATAEEGAEAMTDKAAADVPDPEAEAAAAAAKEAKMAAEAKAQAERDERLDLSKLVPFGQPVDATEEEWAMLQEKAAEYFDPDAGAAGGRAEKKLIAAGKIAWPAILNELIKIDVDDPEQNRMGFRATLAMSKARGSELPNGFDWRSAQNSATGEMKKVDVYYNKRLIKVLYEGWEKVVEDPAHWAKFDKTEASAEAAAKAAAKAEEAAGEFDDLEIPDID